MQRQSWKHNEETKQQSALTTICEKPETIMHGGVQEVLPIVELKPFFKKVWRREKSLPEFYVKLQAQNADDSLENRQPQNHVTRETQHVANCDGKSGVHLPCTPNPSYLESRFNVDTSSRNRTKIHPSTQFSYNCRPQKSTHFIPGFITRAERTKTTLEFAHKWANDANKKRSCLKQIAPSDVLDPKRGMRVKGGKLNENISIKQLFYLNPLPHTRAIEGYHSNPESPFKKANAACSLYGEEKDKYYVSPALSEGEPAKSMVWNRRQMKSSMKQMKFDKNTEMPFKHPGHLHIGHIKNAFEILSNRGKPTTVERKLTFDLELSLEKCRRRADYSKFPPECATSTHHPIAISPNDTEVLATLTRGEVMLMQGRAANRRKRQASGQSLSQDYVDFDRNMRKMAAVQMEVVDVPSSGKLERIEDSFQSVAFENADKNSVSGRSRNTDGGAAHPDDASNSEQDGVTDKDYRVEGSGKSVASEGCFETETSPTSGLVLPEIKQKVESPLESSHTDKLPTLPVATHGQTSLISNEHTEDESNQKSTQTDTLPIPKHSKQEIILSSPKDSVGTKKSNVAKSPHLRDKKEQPYGSLDVRSKAFVTSP